MEIAFPYVSEVIVMGLPQKIDTGTQPTANQMAPTPQQTAFPISKVLRHSTDTDI